MTHPNSTHVVGSLYDNKAGIYSSPILYRSKADFIRNIQTVAKEPQSMLHKHPADYELYIMAEWDENNGFSDYRDVNERLGSVLDLCPLS